MQLIWLIKKQHRAAICGEVKADGKQLPADACENTDKHHLGHEGEQADHLE